MRTRDTHHGRKVATRHSGVLDGRSMMKEVSGTKK
jgi:hypothetical protein